MILKNSLRQRPSRTVNTEHILQLTLILIMISLICCLCVSCGKDDPVSPEPEPETSFEWTIAPPQDHGFDPALLETLTDRVSTGALGRITSVLIVRNGYLVYEEYFRGNDRYDLVEIYSCTKSISSALIGIAIDDGHISAVDTRLFDYLDGYTLFPPNRNDSLYREALTLEHLLTMTAGFSWDESSVPYGSEDNSYNQMVASDDYIQYTLNRPIISEPGTSFEYNTGLSGLMAVVLENSTGQRVDRYAREKLFSRIGIDTCVWRITPTGVPMTGNGINLRPRDMAKFGWLYSRNGVWNGETIVPGEWVQASHQPRVAVPDGRSYGYQWWLAPATDDEGNPYYIPYALGYGGQHIIVPPGTDAVIVVTADDDQDVAEHHIDDIVELIGQAFTP
ncbi:MAG: serine hydrolase [Candidatus Zixiibacteriota bacterium]|nr:MAG: serine hydrolase [candidate division Zixibacteria bacterium]